MVQHIPNNCVDYVNKLKHLYFNFPKLKLIQSELLKQYDKKFNFA